MEEPTYLSPIPNHSTFLFPWSAEQVDLRNELSEYSGDLHYASDPTLLQVGDCCHDDKGMAWKVFSKEENAVNVSMKLLRDNWSLFKDLRLEHWVEHVMEMHSAAISLFESYHDRLGFSLFSFLCQAPGETEKYYSVAEVCYLVEALLWLSVRWVDESNRKFDQTIASYITRSRMPLCASRMARFTANWVWMPLSLLPPSKLCFHNRIKMYSGDWLYSKIGISAIEQGPI